MSQTKVGQILAFLDQGFVPKIGEEDPQTVAAVKASQPAGVIFHRRYQDGERKVELFIYKGELHVLDSYCSNIQGLTGYTVLGFDKNSRTFYRKAYSFENPGTTHHLPYWSGTGSVL